MRAQVAKMLPDVILKLIESLSDTRPAVKQAALKVFPEVNIMCNVYIHIYIYLCPCVCIYVCMWSEGEARVAGRRHPLPPAVKQAALKVFPEASGFQIKMRVSVCSCAVFLSIHIYWKYTITS